MSDSHSCHECPINAGEFQQTVLLSLGELNAGMKSILGNGQPGRLGVVEQSVSGLSKTVAMMVGGLVLLATVFGPAVAYALYLAGKGK